MPERSQFRRAQRGAETVWGTPVAATAILAGVNDIRWSHDYTIVRAEKLDGSLAVANDVRVMGKAGGAMLGGYLSFEDFPYLLEGAYHTETPAGDAGTPIAYTYAYEPALTTENTPKAATLEVGTPGTNQQFQLAGAVPASFEISGAVRDYVMFTSDWIAEDITPNAFTAALTTRMVERIAAQNVKFYLDVASSSTMGTTQITDCVTSFTYRSGDLWALRQCLNGNLTAAGISQQPQDPSLTLEIQQGALTHTLRGYMAAGTPVYVRLEVSGPTAIHTTVFPRIRIDLSAAIIEWPEMGGTERENGLVVPITLQGIDDSVGSYGKLVSYEVVNDVATLV